MESRFFYLQHRFIVDCICTLMHQIIVVFQQKSLSQAMIDDITTNGVCSVKFFYERNDFLCEA